MRKGVGLRSADSRFRVSGLGCWFVGLAAWGYLEVYDPELGHASAET